MKYINKIKSSNAFGFLTIASLLFVSCVKKDLTSDFSTANPKQDGSAKVRFIHAAPDLEGVSVKYNDALIGGDSLRYGSKTGYTEVALGSIDNGFVLDMFANLDSVAIVGNDTITYLTPSSGGLVSNLVQTNLLLKKDQKYAVFIVDTVMPKPEIDKSYAALHVALSESFPAPGSDSCRARFYNLAQTAGSVDIIFTTIINGVPVVKSLTGNKFLQNPLYSSFPSGNYDVEVKSSGIVVASQTGVDMQNGKAYTLFLRGIKNTGGNTALTLDLIVNGE
jgi:hypothetical protein